MSKEIFTTNIEYLIDYCKSLPNDLTDEEEDDYPLSVFVEGAEIELKTLNEIKRSATSASYAENCGHSKLKADVDKQEELVSMLYEFADKQIYKEGEKITHKGMREPDNKFRDIYSVGEYLTKIMKLFGYKITPID